MYPIDCKSHGYFISIIAHLKKYMSMSTFNTDKLYIASLLELIFHSIEWKIFVIQLSNKGYVSKISN